MKKLLREKMEQVNTRLLIQIFRISMPVKLLLTTMQVHALEQTKLIQGALKLAADGTKVILALEAAVVVLLCAKEGILYQKAEPEEKKVHKKNATGVIGVGVLIITATATITAIFSYFQ